MWRVAENSTVQEEADVKYSTVQVGWRQRWSWFEVQYSSSRMMFKWSSMKYSTVQVVWCWNCSTVQFKYIVNVVAEISMKYSTVQACCWCANWSPWSTVQFKYSEIQHRLMFAQFFIGPEIKRWTDIPFLHHPRNITSAPLYFQICT